MLKRMILMLVVVLALLGGIFGWWAYKGIQMGKAMAARKPPPTAVSVATATTDSWQPTLQAVGSVKAVQGVVITNEPAGTIDEIAFESGQEINRGDLLVDINSSTEAAQLQSAKAAVELARQTLTRTQQLMKSNANAQSDLDAAQAQYDQAVATAESLKATMAKKRLVAPFDGRLGIRQVNLGEFLKAGTEIVSLQNLETVYVNFTLPQQALRQLNVGQDIAVNVDTYPGRKFSGKITAIDSRLDAATRSVSIQATLSNQDEALLPGMFAEVKVLLPRKDKVVTVPQTAITYNAYGDLIYVVEPAPSSKDGPAVPEDLAAPAKAGAPVDLVVRQQFVTVGDTRGDQVAIIKGIKPGERVVTAGQLKLRNGVAVSINNTVPTANNPAPTPPNT